MANWNHNNHYHKYILNKLSENKEFALDIGSGDAYFSYLLSKKYKKIISIEPDIDSYNYSNNRYSKKANMTLLNCTFDALDEKKYKFDFIVCIASIHHMNFEKTLIKIKKIMNPGSKLVILGLYKESTFMDYIYSLIAIIPNKIKSKNYKNIDNSLIKTKQATMKISEIKTIASNVLEKYKLKRHLYWRYSLIYKKNNKLDQDLTNNWN